MDYPSSEYITVFTTNNPAIAAVVKSLFDDVEVRYVFYESRKGTGTMFHVHVEDVERAKEILKDMDNPNPFIR
jgi:hypothetical protein